MLTASPDRIHRFIETFGSTAFPHAEELLAIMGRNDPHESEITCVETRLADHLRKIYRRRATHLAASRPSSSYPSGLAADVRVLADGLEVARDQELRVWQTLLPSGTVYLVFELVDDEEIAGCVKSADQRILNRNAP